MAEVGRLLREAWRIDREYMEQRLQLARVCAAAAGQIKMIHRLVEAGAHVNGGSGHGQLPVVCAAAAGQLETVKKLLRLGARPGALDRWGWSAWERAHMHGHGEIAALLALAEGGRPAAAELAPESSQPGAGQKVYRDVDGRQFRYEHGHRIYLDGGKDTGAKVRFRFGGL
jgi:ankyrin repeat protein